MADIMKNEKPASANHRPARLARSAASAAAIIAAVLLSGCAMAKRDSITVGSVPDDYRTNHPIVIGEKEEVLDIPVAASDRGMTKPQRVALDGFLANYDRSAAPVLTVMAPSGSANSLAASEAAHDFARFARTAGVPDTRIMVTSYQASSADVSAPVRVSYTAMKAQTGKCGRWPDDMLNNSENKHYANFGCAYQNNLAAQIANPSDLLGPRKPSEIDAAKRGVAIDVYQNSSTEWSPEINY